MRVGGVEEKEIASKHHCNVEQYGHAGQNVECDTPLAETLKESRSDLQTNHEHKEDKSEVLNKSQNVYWCGEPKMTSHDAGKQYKCYAQCHSTKLDLAQIDTSSNDKRIEQCYMSHRVVDSKQIY